MKTKKITNLNFRKDKKKNVSTLYVDTEHYNDLVDDALPKENQLFSGIVDLSRAMTHYAPYVVVSAIAISIASNPAPSIGGYAELSLIGDGVNSPTFSTALTPTPNSETYDSTLGVLNKVGLYYDGVYSFYTITVIT